MQNAVIYARYSSHSQTEQSIEGQLRVCKEYAEREGYDIVGDYIDRAITGRTDDRPQFQKMLRDSKKRQFDYVIVYKLDRFARNRRDSANDRYKLRMNGVRVISAMEQIGDNPESIILEAVLEAQAEYYSVDLSQKVKRGLRESMIKGNFIGGNIPYGFKVVDKKVLIDEERAQYVRYMFTEYANGTPKKQIVAALIAKGAPSYHGKLMSLNTFQHALTSEKYIGRFTFDKNVYDNMYPAIIDVATFDKVQERLKQNKHSAAAQKAKIKYILNGKAFCGHCGAHMVGTAGTSKTGDRHLYYSCAKRYKYHTCDKKAEKKDFIEYYICEQTVEYVLQPNRMQFIAERVIEEYDKEFNDTSVVDIQKQIAKIDRELDKITNQWLDSPPSVRIRLNEKVAILDAQASDLNIELAKANLNVKNKLTVTEVIEWLKVFTTGDLNDENFRERLIDIFINSVYVFDDKFKIYYNIKDSKQVSFVEMLDDCDQLDENTAQIQDNSAFNGKNKGLTGSHSKPITPPAPKTA